MMVIEKATKMLYIEIGIVICLIISYIHFKLSKRKDNYRTTFLAGQINTSNLELSPLYLFICKTIEYELHP